MRAAAIAAFGGFIAGGLAIVLAGTPEPPPAVRSPPPAPIVTDSRPSIERIRDLAHLVTTRVVVADVITTRIEGHTGSAEAILLARGDALIAIDLAHAEITAIDEARRTCTITLPEPLVTSPRLDHARTRLYRVTNHGLWQLAPATEAERLAIEQAHRQAQQSIATAAEASNTLAEAKRTAAKLVKAYAEALQWSATIEWSTTAAKK